MSNDTVEVRKISAANGDAAVLHDAEQIPVEVSNLLQELVMKKEDVGQGPVDVYLALEQSGCLDAFPKVGSSHKDTPKPNRAETYMGQDENGKAQEKNYFTVWFRDTPIGQRWMRRMADIDLVAKDGKAAQVDDENKDLLAFASDKRARDEEKSLLNSRLGAGRVMVRKSIQLRDVLDKLADYEQVIAIRWNTHVKTADGTNRRKRTRVPFWLVKADDPAMIEAITLGEMLKFGTEATWNKVKAHGFTYEAFTEALKRENNKEPGGSVNKNVKIEKIEDVESAWSGSVSFLNSKDSNGAKRKQALLAEIMQDDELCLAAGSLYLTLDGMWEKFQGRFDRLFDAASKASGSGSTKDELRAAS